MKKKQKVPNVKCRVCGKKFYVKPYFLKVGWGKYCSQKCMFESQRKGKFVHCDRCGKKVWRSPRQLRRSKSKKYFCTKSCQTLWRNKFYSGPNHPLWKGGNRIYKRIIVEAKVPKVCNKCGYKNEKVLLVHHKDKNRKNNNLHNLEYLCRNCHFLTHDGKTF